MILAVLMCHFLHVVINTYTNCSFLHLSWKMAVKRLLLLHVETFMASAEREPITGVWGISPSGVQGRAPGQGRSPLKLTAF